MAAERKKFEPLFTEDTLLRIKVGGGSTLLAVIIGGIAGGNPEVAMVACAGVSASIAFSPYVRDFDRKYQIVARLQHFYTDTFGRKIALLHKVEDEQEGVFYESYAPIDGQLETTHVLEAAQQFSIPVQAQDMQVEVVVDDEDDPVVQEMKDHISRLTSWKKHAYAKIQDNSRFLDIAPNFHPDIDDILPASLIAFGIKGAGKSYMTAVVIEKIAPFMIPMVIFDREGDFVSLLPELPLNGMIAGHISSEIDHPQGKFVEITKENARQMGWNVLEIGYQVVFDLRGYPDDEERAQIMMLIMEGLTAWTDDRENRKKRIPMLLFLDEAQHWLPENEKMSRLKPDTLQKLLYTFVDMAQKGRKRGLIPMYACQRISDLKKSVMGQCDMYLFGRARLNNDVSRYLEYIDPPTLGVTEIGNASLQRAKRIISGLGKGDFVVCMPDGEQFVMHVNLRKSVHVSSTPKADAAMARYGNSGVLASSTYEEEEKERIQSIYTKETQVLSPSTTRLLSLEEVFEAAPKMTESEFAALVLSHAGQVTEPEYLQMMRAMPDIRKRNEYYQGDEIQTILLPNVTPGPIVERMPDLPEKPLLTDREEKVLAAYRMGLRTTRDIEAEIEVNRTDVGKSLKALRDKGYIGTVDSVE